MFKTDHMTDKNMAWQSSLRHNNRCYQPRVFKVNIFVYNFNDQNKIKSLFQNFNFLREKQSTHSVIGLGLMSDYIPS